MADTTWVRGSLTSAINEQTEILRLLIRQMCHLYFILAKNNNPNLIMKKEVKITQIKVLQNICSVLFIMSVSGKKEMLRKMSYIKKTKETWYLNITGPWITFRIEKKQGYKGQHHKGQCTNSALIQERKDEFGIRVVAVKNVNTERMLENSVVPMLKFLNLIM